MTGSPLWGTLVGLTHRGLPLFGLLAQPVLEEIFFGGPSGSWLIKSDRRDRLKAAGLQDARGRRARGDAPRRCSPGRPRRPSPALAERCLLHRFGGDCYNYAMLAAGFIDLVVEAQLKPFDIVPLDTDPRDRGLCRHGLEGATASRRRLRRRSGDSRAARGGARRASRATMCDPANGASSSAALA